MAGRTNGPSSNWQDAGFWSRKSAFESRGASSAGSNGDPDLRGGRVLGIREEARHARPAATHDGAHGSGGEQAFFGLANLGVTAHHRALQVIEQQRSQARGALMGCSTEKSAGVRSRP